MAEDYNPYEKKARAIIEKSNYIVVGTRRYTRNWGRKAREGRPERQRLS